MRNDHTTADSLAGASVEPDKVAAFAGAQAAFGTGVLVAATCFAGFLTLGLEWPGAMVSWAQSRHS